MLTELKKIHFVGIGGSGMSAIARVLLEQGYKKIILVKSVTTVPEEEIGFLRYSLRLLLADNSSQITPRRLPPGRPMQG